MAYLAPLPPPGLPLFPGFIARKPETLHLKEGGFWKAKNRITFGTGQPFLEVVQEKTSLFVAKTPDGKTVMTIQKRKHHFSGKPTEYMGMGPDGRVLWCVSVKYGLTRTKYLIETPTMPGALAIERKHMGKNFVMMHRGQAVMTAETTSGSLSLKREDRIDVAPGMDLLLAVGVQIVDIDKEREDAKAGADAGSSVASAVAT